MKRVWSLVTLMACAPSSDDASSRVESAETTTAYAAFRLVRKSAGTPSAPVISLPAGYTFVEGEKYRYAGRGEYYAFIQGPKTTGITISVSWPGVEIATVIAGESRIPMTGDMFTLAVDKATINANQNTLQVFSYPSGNTSSGIHWRIDHNHPDRAAGYWATVPWPGGEAIAAINYLVATNEILQDSGLAAKAKARGHFFSLMAFETNNLLHLDNPPHWHLAYYPGLTYGAPKAHVPHFWINPQGRTFYNGMDIQGEGRKKYRAGEPAEIHDVEGNLVVTLTIRADGGLDVIPPAGTAYAITTADGDFTKGVQVLRGTDVWRTITSSDDVDAGILVTEVNAIKTTYVYDALTGVIRDVRTTP